MKTFSITLVLLSVSAIAGMPERASLADANPFRQSIASADTIEIFEGLPHQMFEGDLMKKEEMRTDITRIANFPFYTPAIVPKNSVTLKKILSESSAFQLFAGEKACGGFHPDYCLSWTVNAKRYDALICFGCHEIILETEGREFRYDLGDKAYRELQQTLTPYAVKRPKKENS